MGAVIGQTLSTKRLLTPTAPVPHTESVEVFPLFPLIRGDTCYPFRAMI